MRYKLLLLITVVLLSVACTTAYNPLDEMQELKPVTIMDAPAPAHQPGTTYNSEQVLHGKYLVELLGCASCHTDGALVGNPDMTKYLAGSSTGIAYSNPLKQKFPGVVYPANLTPDKGTGIGTWGDEDINRMIRQGIQAGGKHTLPVMPWPAYARISDDDVRSITAYLRSLAPVHHAVPENVPAGRKAVAPYVHFGVYQSRR